MKKQYRPVHRRVALHPLTVMVLLCIGVFLIGTTFKATAETLEVTATVHAAPLTSPAIITSHYDQQHVADAEATIAGTCPDESYVKLFRNNVFSGVAPCEAGVFAIPIVFTRGANLLQVKAYNITDDEGPVAPPITVYYDDAAVTPQVPPAIPATISVKSVDGIEFRSGRTMAASQRPTITGFAPPGSRVTIAIRGSQHTCRTTTNAAGWWTCTFFDALTAGMYGVLVSAVAPDGQSLTFPLFMIQVTASRAPLVPADGESRPLHVNAVYRYQALYQGQNWQWDINVEGGVPPYKVTIEWGDGTTSNRDRDNSDYFTISHIYDTPGTYRPVIKVVDADGVSKRLAVMQLLAIVKPLQGAPMTGSATPFDSLSKYLWLAWPTYIAILLMVISFWLGEMEVARRFRPRRHT